MSSAKRILILGATGSIGVQALDVVARSADLEVVGLSAQSSWEALVAAGARHGVTRIALDRRGARPQRRRGVAGRRGAGGAQGLVELVVESGADLVLNAIVGSAGLGPTIVTLGEGIDLALANKESLVVGGELVTDARRGDGRADPAGRLRARGAAPADRRRARRRPGHRRAAHGDRLRAARFAAARAGSSRR